MLFRIVVAMILASAFSLHCGGEEESGDVCEALEHDPPAALHALAASVYPVHPYIAEALDCKAECVNLDATTWRCRPDGFDDWCGERILDLQALCARNRSAIAQ